MRKILLTWLVTTFTLAQTFIVNPEHSKIKFSVPYMKLMEVEGYFTKMNLFFELDEQMAITKIQGQLPVLEISTADKKRDDHLQKEDFFDAKKYPFINIAMSKSNKEKILFKSSKSLYLDVTIKDKTKAILFDLEYLGERPDPWTKVLGHYFKISGNLNRLDFGLVWNKKLDGEEGFLIGDTVKIEATFESYKSNEKPAFSRFYKEKIDTNEGPKVTAQLEDSSSKVLPSPVMTTTTSSNTEHSSDKTYSSPKNIIITLISGFLVFLLLIAFGIFGQKKLMDLLEKTKLKDSAIFVIASGIIMIALILISVYIAPLMGHGVNPLTKFLN